MAEIYGEARNSVIGAGVVLGKGSVVKDSIIMNNTVIGENCVINKAIIAEGVKIGDNVEIGIGEDDPNESRPDIYNSSLVTIGENTIIPANVKIGKNVAIHGETVAEDYPDGSLPSGRNIVKAGDLV